METREQMKIRKNRELKLEKILLYAEWEERCSEEKHLTWEQWLRLRKLREELKPKPKPIIYKDLKEYNLYGNVIVQSICQSDEDFIETYQRLEKEYNILNSYDTRTLLWAYLKRNRRYCDSINFEGNILLSLSFKYVLNNREHIVKKKLKKQHGGKKDKKHGRKNPTNLK